MIMETSRKQSLIMFCSYIGVFIVYMTVGVYHYWGNLSVYSNSYFRSKLGPDPSIKTPWVISLESLGIPIGSIASGKVAGYIGQRCTMILGCVLLDCGVFLTYFSVQQSVMAVNLSIGVLDGLAIGVIFSAGYMNVVSFEPKHVGLALATIETSITGGAALLNQIITHYINPDNLTPDLFDGREKYFTQEEVLGKVPSVFLLIGLFNLCLQVTGVSLLRYPLHAERGKDRHAHTINVSSCHSEHTNGGNEVETSKVQKASSNNRSQHKTGDETDIELTTISASDQVEDLSPKQIFKQRSFYILWLTTLCTDYSCIMMANFYKSYGQTWISDDQFLANLAATQLIAMMVIRPCWGALVDRCGVKSTLIYMSCAQCVSSSFWYFTPMVNPWMYFLWTVIYACCNSGFYAVIPVVVLKVYGKAHFPENYGWVTSSVILLNLVAPSFSQYVLGRFGWFYLFFSTACGNALVMCLCVVGIPKQ